MLRSAKSRPEKARIERGTSISNSFTRRAVTTMLAMDSFSGSALAGAPEEGDELVEGVAAVAAAFEGVGADCAMATLVAPAEARANKVSNSERFNCMASLLVFLKGEQKIVGQ
jgi:hypothetical protein